MKKSEFRQKVVYPNLVRLYCQNGRICEPTSYMNELGNIAQRFNEQANDIELGGINYGRENHERKNGGS
ncbi:MAG: hypothetical protein QXT63_06145 [Thermoplasmata archaeon]